MAQARKASKINQKINMFVFGEPFSGKTTLGLQLAKLHDENGKPMRLLVLDAEAGGCDPGLERLEAEGVNLDNIYIVYTQSLEETNHYIKLVTEHKDIYALDENGEETDEVVLDADGQPFRAGAILVDGTSVLKMACQQSLLNLSRKRAKVRAQNNGLVGEAKAVAIDGASLEFKDWNNLGFSGQSLILNLAASGVHWVATSREKKETRSEKVNGQIQSVETGKIIADGFKGSEYNSSTLVRVFRDDDEPDAVKMQVFKDRSGTYAVGQIVENPSILDFQPMIDKRNGSDVIVKNSMDKSVEIETKMYQKMAGISDEDNDEAQLTQASPESTLDAAALKKQIKENHSKMNPAQRSEFSGILKKNDLPTAISKEDNVVILSRILDFSKEVLG